MFRNMSASMIVAGLIVIFAVHSSTALPTHFMLPQGMTIKEALSTSITLPDGSTTSLWQFLSPLRGDDNGNGNQGISDAGLLLAAPLMHSPSQGASSEEKIHTERTGIRHRFDVESGNVPIENGNPGEGGHQSDLSMSPTLPYWLEMQKNRRLMKRSPRCLRRCLAQGLLHPGQCHSLC